MFIPPLAALFIAFTAAFSSPKRADLEGASWICARGMVWGEEEEPLSLISRVRAAGKAGWRAALSQRGGAAREGEGGGGGRGAEGAWEAEGRGNWPESDWPPLHLGG